MLHLYWGDGKGKTTAAMGLALRALGHGRRVVILQFLKDGSSGEIEMLRRCGAVVYACPNACLVCHIQMCINKKRLARFEHC